MTRPSLMDKAMLFGKTVTGVEKLAEHIHLYHLDGGEHRFALKFSYAGNVQYHKLKTAEAREIASALDRALSRDGGPDEDRSAPSA